jgi:hypothetical protein
VLEGRFKCHEDRSGPRDDPHTRRAQWLNLAG